MSATEVTSGQTQFRAKGVTLAYVRTLATSASRQVEFGALLHSGAYLSRKAGFYRRRTDT
jgi:hypothetical protein